VLYNEKAKSKKATPLPKDLTREGLVRILEQDKQAFHVGLVGGASVPSAAVRRAQSILRFDRRPSYFSQAFFFSGTKGRILECRLIEADPRHPEKNGIYSDRARRYLDPDSYPNLAIIRFALVEKEFTKQEVAARRKEIRARAQHPNAAQDRFDLLALVSAWQPFLFEPERRPNPLAQETAHPGAAYVRWLLEGADIDTAPGATEHNDAPEHVWAAARRWHEPLEKSDSHARVTIFARITDKECRLKPLEE
jgi:hypothetical protein